MRKMKSGLNLLFCGAILLLAASPLAAYTQEELLRHALQHSFQLETRRLATELAQSQIGESRSEFFPNLAARLTGTWMADPPEGFSIPAGSLALSAPPQDLILAPDAESTYFQFTLNLTQPIFTWGKLNNALKAAQEALEISRLEELKGRRELERDLRKSFASLLFANRAAELLGEAASLYRDIYQDRERSLELGLIHREGLLELRARLVEIESKAREAEYSRRSALESLRLLSGLSGLDFADIEGEIPEPQPLEEDLDSLILRARENNEDLRILEHQIRQAELNAKIQNAMNGPLPDLALSIDFDLAGQKLPWQDDWLDSWSTGLSVTIAAQASIIDGGKRAARTQSARIQAEQARIAYGGLQDSLSLQLSRAYEASWASWLAYQQASSTLDYVEERVKNAQVSFENQLITREDSLGAQILRVTSRLEKLAAAFNAELARADLESFILSYIQ